MDKRFGISKNVFILGLVSFFNDVASEMVYPIIPIFLTSILGAPVAVVGLIEGIAESTASILKVISGWLSDKWKKRKIFVVVGYSFSAISKVILGLAFAWPLVLFSRFIDRFGKGVRTSARDALIVESSKNSVRGRSFGFHRAIDTLGAVIGPLLALLAIHFLDNNFRLIFLLAFIPAVVSIVLLIFWVEEKKKVVETSAILYFRWGELDPSFKIFLLISLIFALGNSSDAFLILRAQNLGLSEVLIVLVYVLFNFAYALFSVPAGIVSDKIGPKKVLLAGFIIFSGVYFFFGMANSSFWLWLLFPIYGIYMAFTEGVSKAYISGLVPDEKIGTAFGFYQTAIGLCAFVSSFVAGLLWTYLGVGAPFIFGSLMAAVSAFLFVVLGGKIKLAKI